MWRSVLVLSLLCWGTGGAVTCKDERNNAVPWYILYKAPSLQSKSLTGLEYLYIDSTTERTVHAVPPFYNGIADRNGVLANTLQPMFTPIRSMPATFGFISYSDQPPGSRASDKFGHSKGSCPGDVSFTDTGVLMMDKTSTGVWLFHSTPQFPFRRDRDHFWPDSGTTNAQIFLCVTFPYSEFNKIGTHLQYIRAYPFEHDLPADFHQELRDAANWVSAQPSNNFMTLMSTDPFQRFSSIAKRTSEQPKDGDLYVTLAQGLNSDVHVQTWGGQPDRKRSLCIIGYKKVLNVKSISTYLGDWEPGNDHSKWCVTKSQDNLWVCIGDVNRATTQYQRWGGALCMENARIQHAFLQFARATDDCSALDSMREFYGLQLTG